MRDFTLGSLMSKLICSRLVGEEAKMVSSE